MYNAHRQIFDEEPDSSVFFDVAWFIKKFLSLEDFYRIRSAINVSQDHYISTKCVIFLWINT